MKVHLIKEETIKEYALKQTNSHKSLHRWLELIKAADWNDIHDMNETFPSADLLGKSSKRVVFNIGGNNYRIICQYNFGKTMIHLYVNWIGTHARYSALCRDNKQYTVDEY